MSLSEALSNHYVKFGHESLINRVNELKHVIRKLKQDDKDVREPLLIIDTIYLVDFVPISQK